MNDQLARMKEREDAYWKNRFRYSGRTLCSIVLCVGIFFFISKLVPLGQTEEQKAAAEAESTETWTDAEWNLLLVNTLHPLSQEFTVSLHKVPGGRVDARVAEPLLQMMADAKQAGIELRVCSAFRDVKTQQRLYAREVQTYEKRGYSEDDSKMMAARFMQPPGASEHHTGLAVDFLAGSDVTLSERFADTPAYAWLQTNAARYGFVERYRADKEAQTGIAWEPWHYRYVGQTHADAMNTAGQCLEEYLQPPAQ